MDVKESKDGAGDVSGWILLDPGRPLQTALDGLFGYGKRQIQPD